MPLNLEGKKAIVEEVSQVAKDAVSLVGADYRGLSVTALTSLRSEAAKNGVYLKVVRNTLAKRAVQDTDFSCVADKLVGPLILGFSLKEPGAAARIMRDFAKEHEKFEIKLVSLSGEAYGPESLDKVASLPTYEEALSMLMNVMLAPITKLVRTMAEPYSKLVRTVAAVKDQKQSQG